jgi:DNA-binding transcriptional ArsR family regulator
MRRDEAEKMPSHSIDIETMLANAQEASTFLKALSHEARLVILCVLIDGEKSVGDLEKLLMLRQPAVSQQLARLRADNLVGARREGKNIYYSLARPEVREIVESLHRSFCAVPSARPGRKKTGSRLAAARKSAPRKRVRL